MARATEFYTVRVYFKYGIKRLHLLNSNRTRPAAADTFVDVTDYGRVGARFKENKAGARLFWLFFDPPKKSNSLFLRISGRKPLRTFTGTL